jgi:hypothetical protein
MWNTSCMITVVGTWIIGDQNYPICVVQVTAYWVRFAFVWFRWARCGVTQQYVKHTGQFVKQRSEQDHVNGPHSLWWHGKGISHLWTGSSICRVWIMNKPVCSVPVLRFEVFVGDRLRIESLQKGLQKGEPDNRRRSDQKTSWRHSSSVDVAPWKRLCTFFYRIYPKENILRK